MEVPAEYDGREHQAIKHGILEAYLERLFMITGQKFTEICYVDAFAGPWSERDPNLNDTSIGISLRIMEKCRSGLAASGKNLTMRALFIEEDKGRFAKLQTYLAERTGSVKAECLQGNFVDLRQQILDWAGPKPFCFFFIDPTGWKGLVGASVLERFLQRPNSECLINFMYDFINRAVPQKEAFVQEMHDLFGTVPNIGHLSPPEKENYLINLYKEQLTETAECATGRIVWVSYFAVQKIACHRTHYHLVYLTGHPLGTLTFGEISAEYYGVQNEQQASLKIESSLSKKLEQSSIDDMFGVGTIEIEDQPLVDIEIVKEFWLNRLTDELCSYSLSDFADILVETDWFPSSHQQALGELIKEGKVINPNWTKRRRTEHVKFKKGELIRKV